MLNLRMQSVTIQRHKKVLCSDLSLTIKPGERWAILGPNGVGKTTLLHALAGLQKTTTGQIYLADKKLVGITRKCIAQSIGLLLQHFTEPFAQTVWEYCQAARYPHADYFHRETVEDKRIIQAAIETMDLCNHQLSNVQKLSSGEKRRLSLAALLAQTPSIYLLDEPTNHLDIRMQMHTFRHLTHLARTVHATIVMSLHDANLAARFSDYALLLFRDGTHLHGATQKILTTENLSRLYEIPMRIIEHDQTTFWYATT